MAVNKIAIDARPELIFGVLSDPMAYSQWVVGPDHIVTASPNWPEPGSWFIHEDGKGPLRHRDRTEVVELDPGRRLVLSARVFPFVARVDIRLELAGEGTLVTMIEGPGTRSWKAIWNPIFDRLMHKRNEVALERLKDLVLQRA